MSQNPTPERKPYETPALTKEGKADEITQGVNVAGTDQGTVSI